MSAANALTHPFLDEGRLRYHTYMCSCTDHQFSTSPGGAGGEASPEGARGRRGGNESPLEEELDPVCATPFGYDFEEDLISVVQVRGIRQLDIALEKIL